MRRTSAYVGAVAGLAAHAQGQLLTLSAVEMITSFAVPLSCIFAYNTPLSGCEIGDFTNGRCSANCQRGLQRVQANIRASCDTVEARPNSLIWEAQRGNLVNALCKSDAPERTATAAPTRLTPTPITTSAASITVTIPLSTTKSSKEASSTTAPTTDTRFSSSTDSSSTPETESSDTESSSSTVSTTTSTTSERITSTAADRSTSSSSPLPAAKTTKPTREQEKGAGDPFANLPNSSSQLGPYVWSLALVLFVIGLM
ncbi:hypothetical protein NLG97_g7679 [Lecanicillium saksenae]|uniref:Uncharacterized protein n=1 Tax=Lecanicillium saksenae TaxID=468837 RepID=A0ACC1QPZ9_9HYPO|nr:hypothetical protein NLG97_g7679 [Lecanicillium saksenae]